MKKTKGLAIVLIIAVIISAFVACSSKPAYNDKEVDFTEIVTDEGGQAVTEAVTNADGTAVTNADGTPVTQAVTQAETTNKTSANNSNSTTKKQNSNKPSSTSTTKPTTTKPTTAVGQSSIDKKDVELEVVLPYVSDKDQGQYTLYVKIDNDTLNYPIKDGCKGQKITIIIPKKYNGKKAVISMDIQEKKYTKEATIKAGATVALETIIVVEGVDD